MRFASIFNSLQWGGFGGRYCDLSWSFASQLGIAKWPLSFVPPSSLATSSTRSIHRDTFPYSCGFSIKKHPKTPSSKEKLWGCHSTPLTQRRFDHFGQLFGRPIRRKTVGNEPKGQLRSKGWTRTRWTTWRRLKGTNRRVLHWGLSSLKSTECLTDKECWDYSHMTIISYREDESL